jgi:hypothetical protein
MMISFLDIIFNGCSYLFQTTSSVALLAQILMNSKGQRDTPGSEYLFKGNREQTSRSTLALMEIAAIESTANLLIGLLLVAKDANWDDGPKILHSLSDGQRAYLAEERQDWDSKGKQKPRAAYIPVLDKLEAAFSYAIQIFGGNTSFSKGNAYWSGIVQLKEIRDQITHPSFDIEKLAKESYLSQIRPGATVASIFSKMLFQSELVEVSDEVLINGAKGARWYLRQVYEYLLELLPPRLQFSCEAFLLPDSQLHSALRSLTLSTQENDGLLRAEFPEIGSMRYGP